MALIKRQNAAELTRSAIVLDLGDLHRQGHALVQAAQAKAKAIIDEAHKERARIIAGAFEQGKAEGLASGMADGLRQGTEAGRVAAIEEQRAQLANLQAGLLGALEVFLAQRERMLAEARRDVLALACLMAEKVTKRTIELDDQVAASQLAELIALVLRPTRLRVRIAPADRPVLDAALPALSARFTSTGGQIELIDDPSLTRGSCIADLAGPDGSPGGEIDASINTQLQRIVETLLPPSEPTKAEPAP
jgi:flagellar biosynthesis/type III secretory pathway protein FliH